MFSKLDYFTICNIKGLMFSKLDYFIICNIQCKGSNVFISTLNTILLCLTKASKL